MRFKAFSQFLLLVVLALSLSACNLVGDAVITLKNDGSGHAEVLFFEALSTKDAQAQIEQHVKQQLGEAASGKYRFSRKDGRLSMEVEFADLREAFGDLAAFSGRDDGTVEVWIPINFFRKVQVILPDGKVKEVLDPLGKVSESKREVDYLFTLETAISTPIHFVFEPSSGFAMVALAGAGVLVLLLAGGVVVVRRRKKKEGAALRANDGETPTPC